MKKVLTQLLIAFLFLGMATPAFAAKDFNIKTDTNTFLFVNGTSGNVGIGTVVPAARLAIVGVGAGTSRAFEIDDNLYNIKFVVLDNGNVGIGTTNPQGQVHLFSGNINTANVNANTLVLEGVGNKGISILTTNTGIGYVLFGDTETANKGQIAYNHLDDSFRFGHGLLSEFTLNDTGNIGIGTSVSMARLHIGGEGALPDLMPSTGNDLYVKGNIEVDGKIYADGFSLTNIPADGLDKEVQFNDAGLMTGAAGFVYDKTSGNVGIGTTVPMHLLEVAGDISVTGSSDSYFMSNVGVGTSVPAYKLDVVGTLNATGAVTLGSTLGVAGALDVNGAADIAGALNLSGNALTSSGALTITPAATNNLNVVLSGAGDLVVNTDQLYVDTLTGNVGIGTAAPRAMLDVDGPIFIGQVATPSPATDRLYNTAGNLFWSGTQLAVGAALTWNVVSGTSQGMSVNNGYVANNVALVTVTLPATAAAGTVVAVTGGLGGAGGWKIAQNAGQTIHFGSVDTTTGVTGYLSSNNQFDGVQLVCVQANTDFVVIASQGNITYF